jgi:hypothetical protein
MARVVRETSAVHNRQRNTFIFGLIVLIATVLSSPALHAFDVIPFNSQNQSPFVRIFGLPSAGSAMVLPQGRKEAQVTLDHSSSYLDDEYIGEHLVIDGETTRLTLTGRYGLTRGVEVGIEIPYVYHGGGFLDNAIIDYHDRFGFSPGRRDEAPNNRLLFKYRRRGVDQLKIDASGGGLGDVVLTAGLQLYNDAAPYPRAVALRAGIKLPTGDSDSLFGSGSTDLSLWLTGSDDFKLPIGSGTLFAAGGVMVMTKGNILPEQQRNWVGFGTVGLGWKPLSRLAIKIQMDGHTPLYEDSSVKHLSANAAQLLVGGTFGLTERTSLDMAVSEDIIVDTAPDVAFHFNLRTIF